MLRVADIARRLALSEDHVRERVVTRADFPRPAFQIGPYAALGSRPRGAVDCGACPRRAPQVVHAAGCVLRIATTLLPPALSPSR